MAAILGGLIGHVYNLVLSPFVTGPLLAAITYRPNESQNLLSTYAGGLPGLGALDLKLAITALRLLFGVGLLRFVNQNLNVRAANAWRTGPSKGWNWSEEIAVVTGGASGIGKDLARNLAGRGTKVVVLDIQDMPMELHDNPLISHYHCDLMSKDSIGAAAAAVRKDVGHPTILVNNAGVSQAKPILDQSEPYLRSVFGVNNIAHWLCVQQFMPHMIEKNKGHIVTVASIGSFVSLSSGVAYAATKAAALAFHEGLGVELKHIYRADNVLTTVVHPFFVDTPLIAEVANGLTDAGLTLLTSNAVADAISERIWSKRGGQVTVPNSRALLSGVRAWPGWLQEVLRDIIGSGTRNVGEGRTWTIPEW